MKEVWKDIKDYEGEYQISNTGKVKSFKRKKNFILKPLLNKRGKGYFQVFLSNRKRLYIHRLVAIAFIPNPENKPQINHKDGNGLNNNISNLEWATRSENQIHAYKTGLQIPMLRENHYNTRLSKEDINKIRKLRKKNIKQSELAKQFKVARQTISAIVNFKNRYKI